MASIVKRSDNSYHITVCCGYDTNGKKLRKYKTVNLPEGMTERQKEKEIQKQAALFEREVENGTYLDGEKITFAEFADKWLVDYAEKQLAPSTLNPYKLRLSKRIIPALGHLKLARIQPHHLLEFYNNLAEKGIRLDSLYFATDKLKTLLASENKVHLSMKTGIGRKTFPRLCIGKGVYYETAELIMQYYKLPLCELFTFPNDEKLSSKTIRHHHTLISAIFSTAVSWGIIENNPANRVKLPKVGKAKQLGQNFYDDEQLCQLFVMLEDEPIKYKTIVYLTIDTGLRLSELAGLKWQDINLEQSSLIVDKQRQYVSQVGIFEKDPKSQSGVREVSMSKMANQLLCKYQLHQAENRLKHGNLWIDSGYIFVHEDGEPMFPHRPSIWFQDFLKRKGLPKITFHGLRHTNASMLIAEGIDIVSLSNRLGHADKNVTLNTYSHILTHAHTCSKIKNVKLLIKWIWFIQGF